MTRAKYPQFHLWHKYEADRSRCPLDTVLFPETQTEENLCRSDDGGSDRAGNDDRPALPALEPHIHSFACSLRILYPTLAFVIILHAILHTRSHHSSFRAALPTIPKMNLRARGL
jgi:hypothetical protein